MTQQKQKNSSPGRPQIKHVKPDAAPRALPWLIAAGLLLVTLASYQPAWRGGMLWDDDAHITRTSLRSTDGLWRIWAEPGATQQYYPVVHSVFWVLHRIWGEETAGYHLLNIFLHALSAFLTGLILRRLAVPGAWIAALIFALHPVNVESVAWITELKNTLSGVFYLSAALSYLRFDGNRDRRSYGIALAFFVFAVLSKTVTATLPAALLVVFWWRRGRLSLRRDVLPLTPFFVFGAAAGLVTVWVERTLIGARGGEFQFTLIERFLIAGRVVWFYLGKLIWPTELVFIYPRWQISQGVWWQYLYPVGLAALFAGLWVLRRRTRAPLAALLLFCGTLFPALGFINVYPFRFSFVADHFLYLAGISIMALISSGLAIGFRKWNAGWAVPVLALGFGLGFMTWNQSRQYADAETLYDATLARNPSCWMAHSNLGMLKLDKSIDEAVAHFEEALRLKPDVAEAHCNLGNALQRLGRFDEAMSRYREALRLDPALAEAHNNLSNLLIRSGRFEESVEEARAALKITPDYVEAHYNLATALHRLGRSEEAVKHYRESLRLDPEFAEIHNDLGFVLQGMGRLKEAATHYTEALRVHPGYAAAHYNLGNVLMAMGYHEEAVPQYLEALRIMPGNSAVHNNLGAALETLGRLDEALEEYREAMRLDPSNAGARNNAVRISRRLGR